VVEQPSIEWPHAWRSLDCDRAAKRGDSFSIFLDGRLEPQLIAFLATQREKRAVEIGGRKMHASYRRTLPVSLLGESHFRVNREL
jgi:hypothetical protein